MSSQTVQFQKSSEHSHKGNEESLTCQISGSDIVKVFLDTPIGPMELVACDSGLHSIQLESQIIMKSENFSPNMSSSMDVRAHRCNSTESENSTNCDSNTSDEKLELGVTNVHLTNAICWLRNYFGVNEQRQPLILGDTGGLVEQKFCFPNSTDFERKVWMTLLEGTGCGETITYQHLAEKVNCPRGSRAVGGANKKNPILILIPCHRVIRSDGSLGKYIGGTSMKDFLQRHEKTHFASD